MEKAEMDQSRGGGQNLRVETDHTLLAFFRFGQPAELGKCRRPFPTKVSITVRDGNYDF